MIVKRKINEKFDNNKMFLTLNRIFICMNKKVEEVSSKNK